MDMPLVPETAVAITIRDLRVSYPDKPDILQKLNLQVPMGSRLGVIGPNGAGKTTCFHSICGLLKPTAGEIFIFDRQVIPGEFRPDVGLVFQNPDDQLFSASVWEDVAFGPENLRLSPEAVKQRVAQALQMTGTEHLADRAPHHLSGGQKRMVAIAGVLAMDPQVIIYDEPSANLDARSRRRLIQFLQRSQQTLMIASHDLEFILEVCQRVILLDGGQVVAEGTCQEIMANEDLMIAHALERPHSLVQGAHSHTPYPYPYNEFGCIS